MICFKDKTYCSGADTCKKECTLRLSDIDMAEAKLSGLPVCYSDYRFMCKDFKSTDIDNVVSEIEEKRNSRLMQMSNDALTMVLADIFSMSSFGLTHPVRELSVALGGEQGKLGEAELSNVALNIGLELAYRITQGGRK